MSVPMGRGRAREMGLLIWKYVSFFETRGSSTPTFAGRQSKRRKAGTLHNHAATKPQSGQPSTRELRLTIESARSTFGASNSRPYGCGAHAAPTELRGRTDSHILKFVTGITSDAIWPRTTGYTVGCCSGHRPITSPISSSGTVSHLPRHVADELALFGAASVAHSARRGDFAMCTERFALQHARVQQVRGGAPQVEAEYWIVLHYLGLLRLPLMISPSLFLSPSAPLHTAALPLNLRLTSGRASVSEASALASDHAAVCYLLLRAPPEHQNNSFCKAHVGRNADPLCAQTPSKTALWDRGAESGRAPFPPHPHATRPTPSPNPKPTRRKCAIRGPPCPKATVHILKHVLSSAPRT